MRASAVLLESFVKQVRRNVIHAMLALPRHAPPRPRPAAGASPIDEQPALERWLFERDGR